MTGDAEGRVECHRQGCTRATRREKKMEGNQHDRCPSTLVPSVLFPSPFCCMMTRVKLLSADDNHTCTVSMYYQAVLNSKSRMIGKQECSFCSLGSAVLLRDVPCMGQKGRIHLYIAVDRSYFVRQRYFAAHALDVSGPPKLTCRDMKSIQENRLAW